MIGPGLLRFTLLLGAIKCSPFFEAHNTSTGASTLTPNLLAKRCANPFDIQPVLQDNNLIV